MLSEKTLQKLSGISSKVFGSMPVLCGMVVITSFPIGLLAGVIMFEPSEKESAISRTLKEEYDKKSKDYKKKAKGEVDEVASISVDRLDKGPFRLKIPKSESIKIKLNKARRTKTGYEIKLGIRNLEEASYDGSISLLYLYKRPFDSSIYKKELKGFGFKIRNYIEKTIHIADPGHQIQLLRGEVSLHRHKGSDEDIASGSQEFKKEKT